MVDVPTMVEFNALKDRVTALENVPPGSYDDSALQQQITAAPSLRFTDRGRITCIA